MRTMLYSERMAVERMGPARRAVHGVLRTVYFALPAAAARRAWPLWFRYRQTWPRRHAPAASPNVVTAASRVLRALDEHRDAHNGVGHPGRPHDRMLGSDVLVDGVSTRDIVDDCALCNGTMYSLEDELNIAHGDLRQALGGTRRPWEQ